MRTFTRKKKYKARDPYETITLIRNILAERDIFVSENNNYFGEAELSSCRLWFSDPALSMGDFGTNGKGMNPRYALASAYGELMERLQNNVLFGDYAENAFHKGLTSHMAAADEVMLDSGEALEEGGEILARLLRCDLGELKRGLHASANKMPCLKFEDVLKGGEVLLPFKTLRMCIGTNGMAAGNTYKEAIIQGMSEIYERAAVMEAYRDNPKIPQINPLCFKGNEIYDRLEHLKMYGYDYKILDLSMGKGYPAVGLRLGIGRAAAFKAGADPCPVTALERCLTEMFQGSLSEIQKNFHDSCCADFKSADERMKREISEAEIAYHVDGTGKIARCLFNPANEFSEDFAGTDGESEDADFEYMLELTRNLGYGLYVRDSSVLGFPSYQIIIPELSNYDLLYEDGKYVYEWSFDKQEFKNDRITEGVAAILNKIYSI